MRKSFGKLILWILGCLLLVASLLFLRQAISLRYQDNSILVQGVCSFPCWRGLTPGQSTLNDVRNFLVTDDFVPKSGVIDALENYHVFFWGEPDQRNRLTLVEDTLFSIEVVPNVTFMLEDIINLYGNPDAMSSRFEVWRSTNEVTVILSLFYLRQGLVIDFNFSGGDVTNASSGYSLYPEIAGRRFWIYEPQVTLREFSAHAFHVSGEQLDEFLASLTLGWTGFNSIIIHAPDTRSFSYSVPLILTMTPTP